MASPSFDDAYYNWVDVLKEIVLEKMAILSPLSDLTEASLIGMLVRWN